MTGKQAKQWEANATEISSSEHKRYKLGCFLNLNPTLLQDLDVKLLLVLLSLASSHAHSLKTKKEKNCGLKCNCLSPLLPCFLMHVTFLSIWVYLFSIYAIIWLARLWLFWTYEINLIWLKQSLTEDIISNWCRTIKENSLLIFDLVNNDIHYAILVWHLKNQLNLKRAIPVIIYFS